MRKKIFAVSDIHGHATLLKEALLKAGFNENAPDHLLVVCGDCFDRGKENRAVYLYLDRIKNKVLIRGNHEDILEDIIHRSSLTETDMLNGTERTVTEFFGRDYSPEQARLYIDKHSSGYKELMPFLNSMRDFFETENYVFTHGWLPLVNQGTVFVEISKRWRHATTEDWRMARWTKWHHVYPYHPIPQDKTLVVGHRSADYGSMFDPNRKSKCHDPFYGEGMIAIDAMTAVSGQINVLTLEDEVPDPLTYKMKLMDEYYQKIKSGEKIYEIRLLDKKRNQIRPGDKIKFQNTETENLMTVSVVATYRFRDFRELVTALPQKELGFNDKSKTEITELLNGIYNEESQKEFCALAIKIQSERRLPQK